MGMQASWCCAQPGRQAAVEVVCLMIATVSPHSEAQRTASLPLNCPAQPNGQETCLPAQSVHGGSLLARGGRPRPRCASGTATPLPACSRRLLWRLQPGQAAAQPIHLHDAVQQVLCTVFPAVCLAVQAPHMWLPHVNLACGAVTYPQAPPGRLQLLPPGCCALQAALLKCWPPSDAEHKQLDNAGTLCNYSDASRLNALESHLLYLAAVGG